jgi:hypothetical protein
VAHEGGVPFCVGQLVAVNAADAADDCFFKFFLAEIEAA